MPGAGIGEPLRPWSAIWLEIQIIGLSPEPVFAAISGDMSKTRRTTLITAAQLEDAP